MPSEVDSVRDPGPPRGCLQGGPLGAVAQNHEPKTTVFHRGRDQQVQALLGHQPPAEAHHQIRASSRDPLADRRARLFIGGEAPRVHPELGDDAQSTRVTDATEDLGGTPGSGNGPSRMAEDVPPHGAEWRRHRFLQVLPREEQGRDSPAPAHPCELEGHRTERFLINVNQIRRHLVDQATGSSVEVEVVVTVKSDGPGDDVRHRAVTLFDALVAPFFRNDTDDVHMAGEAPQLVPIGRNAKGLRHVKDLHVTLSARGSRPLPAPSPSWAASRTMSHSLPGITRPRQ